MNVASQCRAMECEPTQILASWLCNAIARKQVIAQCNFMLYVIEIHFITGGWCPNRCDEQHALSCPGNASRCTRVKWSTYGVFKIQ